MNPAERIIDMFGGLAATAKALGHKNVTTVQGWKIRGVIPIRQIPRVIEAAREKDKPVTASMLLPSDSDGRAA